MTALPATDPVEFIRSQTIIAVAPIVPELMLHLATEVTPLWQLTETRMQEKNLPPPFWAFAWPGGQGVARYVLDHPESVRGKQVMDFAAGGGIAALAAMKAGAAHALAVDIDPLALTAIQLNAALNHVAVENANGIDLTTVPEGIDVIVAGDICYQQEMADRLMRWLRMCVAAGIRVIMADPGRAYVPQSGLTELANYMVPTSLDLEHEDKRHVRVWDVGVPEA